MGRLEGYPYDHSETLAVEEQRFTEQEEQVLDAIEPDAGQHSDT